MQNFLVLLLISSGCAGWSKRDIGLEGAFALAQTADMLQTINITSACQEDNPIIGHCGQHVSPHIWFPLTTLLHVFVMDKLPGSRPWVQGISLGIEVTTVYRNHLVGTAF